jgi:single-strand DNA-binding protein
VFIPVQSVARLANFNETVAGSATHFTTISLATKSSYKKDSKYISHTESHRLPAVMFGVGVAFDFLAGTKS